MIERLRATLQAAGIRNALVVDDAYDEVPLAEDMSIDADSWVQFFDDLNEDDRNQLEELFPGFNEQRADSLRANNSFVQCLWRERSTLRAELISPLFQRYEQDKSQDTAYLTTLTSKLQSFGLHCDKCGRDFIARARTVDLIIIDLFLNSAQTQDAFEAATTGLKEAISTKRSKPPLVVLMSRSDRLKDKRAEFRDESGLFESAFRIIRKAELSDEGKLARILMRLGTHYAESTKLAAFLDAWEDGLSKACARTVKLIRTLDISDYAQVQQVLLSEEGEPTGSYLVDVFDRVLQHEVEREAKIIDTASNLNTLNISNYPPPYVSGSPDLQLLVFRSIFQNRERLRLTQAEGSRVAFGDILRRIPPAASAAQPPQVTCPLGEIQSGQVLLVLTPACDLQRGAAERVLLLVGTLEELLPKNWSYAETPVRTPIIEMPDGQRFWVRWNLKHVEAVSQPELGALLGAEDGFTIVGRLRESAALELQQKLLSSLGRVGLPAPMPGTFPLRVGVFLPGSDKKPFAVNVPELAPDCGVCFVGRTGDKDMRLVFSEDDCEAICKALASVPVDQIHPDARESVMTGLNGGDLLVAMERGIVLPSPQQQGYKAIVSQNADEQGASGRTIGFICRSPDVPQQLTGGEVKKAGIILSVSEISSGLSQPNAPRA